MSASVTTCMCVHRHALARHSFNIVCRSLISLVGTLTVSFIFVRLVSLSSPLVHARLGCLHSTVARPVDRATTCHCLYQRELFAWHSRNLFVEFQTFSSRRPFWLNSFTCASNFYVSIFPNDLAFENWHWIHIPPSFQHPWIPWTIFTRTTTVNIRVCIWLNFHSHWDSWLNLLTA